MSVSRRTFIAASSAITVTFLSACAIPVIPKRPAPKLEDAQSWVTYVNGKYTVFIPRVEMGQNILTACKQIACEELGVEWAALTVLLPTTNDISRVRATVGSESIKDFALPLAQACATLRDAIAKGMQQGTIVAKNRPVQSLRVFQKNGRYVGKKVVLEQATQIVKGEPVFVSDVRLADMVFARVVRAPALPELRTVLLSCNEAAAKQVTGFVAIVRSELLQLGNATGLGIVAKTPAGLNRMEAALACQWQIEELPNMSTIAAAMDIDARMAKGALSKTVAKGGVDQKSRGNVWDVDIRIDVPLAAHGSIEPRCAVAKFTDSNHISVWVGSQDVFYQRDVIAKRLALNEKNVLVHGMRVGGAFGGKTICTVELEAAVIAKMTGQAVKVQWTREQELQFGFHRPPSSHRVRASLKDGKIDTWWHGFSSGHIIFTNAVVPSWLQKLTDFVGDDGVARGAAIPYAVRSKQIEYDLVRLPVFTGPWRGLGAAPNNFAIESAMDECARAAKADAIDFRLRHIEDVRLVKVLRRVEQISGWKNSVGAKPEQRGENKVAFGVACGIYKNASYVAVVAEVHMNDVTKAVLVKQVWCVHDCGQLINPDQVRAQCEGNIVWGLGMVLRDVLPVENSRLKAPSFAQAPIPRYSEVPLMQIDLIDDGHPPTGSGETAVIASGAAIANAIRTITGIRISCLPYA
jgi:isoquinoline 1-oxidoreductase subunit beta